MHIQFKRQIKSIACKAGLEYITVQLLHTASGAMHDRSLDQQICSFDGFYLNYTV
jgi:hypothetical protein